MSDNGNDGKTRNHFKPLVEHTENYEASMDISGSMEGSSSGEPFTAEKQVLRAHSIVDEQVKDTSSSHAEGTRVHVFLDKREEIGKKTYTKMASALPRGAERHTYQRHVRSGEPYQVDTMQEHQSYDQHLQGVVKSPLQENLEQGLHSLQGSSNKDCLCQGSNPPAPAYESKDQHLQGSVLEGSALPGDFEVMLFALY